MRESTAICYFATMRADLSGTHAHCEQACEGRGGRDRGEELAQADPKRDPRHDLPSADPLANNAAGDLQGHMRLRKRQTRSLQLVDSAEGILLDYISMHRPRNKGLWYAISLWKGTAFLTVTIVSVGAYTTTQEERLLDRKLTFWTESLPFRWITQNISRSRTCAEQVT